MLAVMYLASIEISDKTDFVTLYVCSRFFFFPECKIQNKT